jgi:hypothetical protein
MLGIPRLAAAAAPPSSTSRLRIFVAFGKVTFDMMLSSSVHNPDLCRYAAKEGSAQPLIL